MDIAVKTAQGMRPYMEDFVHVEHPFLGRSDAVYVAVFDGHGGDTVARRAAEGLHRILAVEMEHGPAEVALPRTFRAFDAQVSRETSGAVAVVAVLLGRGLTVANAGDCHALLVSRAGQTILTMEHRLSNEEEFRRVVAAGAHIWGPYACLPDGSGLMATRTLGDPQFRAIGIIADPSVTTRALGSEDEWLVLASDGVWDGLDAEAVAALVRPSHTARQAAERLTEAALGSSTDNVSVAAIRLS